MDEQQDRTTIKIKFPKVGALVKVVSHFFDHLETHVETEYGIVVDHKPENSPQLRIFPEVSVYIIKRKKIVAVPLSGIEIVSN